MEFEQLLQLIDHVSDSKVTSFQYEGENLKLSMECGAAQRMISGDAPPAPGTASYEMAAIPIHASVGDGEKQAAPDGNLVKSPLVGTFYAAPSEEAEPFVKPGDKVKKGQVLGIVEAMKLMNDIESDFDGEVAEIYVKNGDAVEYGMPLFRIE